MRDDNIRIIKIILEDMEKEINSLDDKTKKALKNTVYPLGYQYLKTIKPRPDMYYAIIIEKPWFKNYKLVIKSSKAFAPSDSKVRFDDYRIYKNYEDLNIFDDESLVKLKYFLFSFIGEEQ